MASDANPTRSAERRAAEEQRFAEISDALLASVERVVAHWIERLVLGRVREWSGHVSPEVAAAAVAAGGSARDDVVPKLRALLAADVDDQRTNPLALLRSATAHATAVLRDLGVPAAPRDQFARGSFPDDTYGLVPASWEDVDPSLHEIGMTWGAAKAYVFTARRRDEGTR
jgi:hypothetical protein